MEQSDSERVVLTKRDLEERIRRARCSGIEEGYRLGLIAEPGERADLDDEIDDGCGMTEEDNDV